MFFNLPYIVNETKYTNLGKSDLFPVSHMVLTQTVNGRSINPNVMLQTGQFYNMSRYNGFIEQFVFTND